MARRKLRNLDNRILKKVVSHGSETGIDSISTKTIAEEIGITEPTIYVHFNTRNNVLLVANEFAINSIKESASQEEGTLVNKWGALLKAASLNPEAAKYAYYYRQKNVSADYDEVFSKFVDTTDSIKASVCEHFMYEAATGCLEVNDENVKKTFAIISSL